MWRTFFPLTLKTLRGIRRCTDERRSIPGEYAFGEALQWLATMTGRAGWWAGRTGSKDDDVVFRGDFFHDGGLGDVEGVQESRRRRAGLEETRCRRSFAEFELCRWGGGDSGFCVGAQTLMRLRLFRFANARREIRRCFGGGLDIASV
jgi:hypothetical protein